MKKNVGLRLKYKIKKHKKKILISLLALVLIAAISLIIPIPGTKYGDGTKEYNAVLYKKIKWNKNYNIDLLYEETNYYFGKNKELSIDELWSKLPESQLNNKVYVLGYDNAELQELDEEDAQAVFDIMNHQTTWQEGTHCDNQYIFEVGEIELFFDYDEGYIGTKECSAGPLDTDDYDVLTDIVSRYVGQVKPSVFTKYFMNNLIKENTKKQIDN